MKRIKTDKYIFKIEKIHQRERSEDEIYRMEHGLGYIEKAPRYADEVIWSQEFEIKDSKVIDILMALLK